MENTTALEIRPNTDAECEVAIDQYLTEMEHMKRQMAESQREIETLRAETDAVLVNIMQMLKAA